MEGKQMSNTNCEHFMQFNGSIKELYWEEGDILVQRDAEKWVCDHCGDTQYVFQESERELVDIQ
jgi:hypothetical protein